MIAQTRTINVDSRMHCYLIPDSSVVSGLTPGLNYRVRVAANGTITAPMQGVFFMYADVNGQCNFNYTPIGSSFTFRPTNGSYQIAPIYVDWSSKLDNNGSLKITISLSDNFYAADSNTNLLLYLNESSGNTAFDSSGNGNNATATGTTIVSGNYGNARNFNGTSDYLLSNNSSSLNITDKITVEAWVNPTENRMINIFSKEGAYQFYIYSDGRFSFGVYSGYPWHNIDSKGIVPLNQWTHIAGTFDNSTKKFQLFKNGVLDKDTVDMNASLTSGSQSLYIGRNGSASVYYMKGMLDEMRISNSVRTFLPITNTVRSLSGKQYPIEIELHQNYPNPFNPATTIQYELSKPSTTEINIYDSIGKLVRTMGSVTEGAGQHSVVWDGLSSEGTTVSSGTYFYQIKADDYIVTKKMILLR
jgi:hypothetical protein